MKKFYKYTEYIDDESSSCIDLSWWESEVDGVPTSTINNKISLLTTEETPIYEEYLSNPVLHNLEERISDGDKFPPSTDIPA
jgi:hypothetical protein